jgi:hypothetical protein
MAGAAASHSLAVPTKDGPLWAAMCPGRRKPDTTTTTAAGKLHPLATRLPKPRKTGNELEDADSADRYLMLQNLLTQLIEDDSHVPSLYLTLQKRRARDTVLCGYDKGMMFGTETPTVKFLATNEMPWLIEFLVDHTTLPADLFVKLFKVDPDAPGHLASYGTGFPLQLKMTSECQLKPVMRKVMDEQTNTMENRLAKLAGAHAISEAGVIWAHGSYICTFDADGKLDKIAHTNGDQVKVENFGITKTSHGLQDNWSDWTCDGTAHLTICTRCPNVSAVRVCSVSQSPLWWPRSDGPGSEVNRRPCPAHQKYQNFVFQAPWLARSAFVCGPGRIRRPIGPTRRLDTSNFGIFGRPGRASGLLRTRARPSMISGTRVEKLM